MKKKVYKLIIILLLALLSVAGCSPRMRYSEGKPIEPISPGNERGETPAVGQFSVKSSDVQITDLAVTTDGSLTAVGTAAKVVYLLQRDGTALWEKEFSSVPLKTYLDPSGRFLAVGTEGGRLTVLTPEQIELYTHQFEAPVAQIAASVKDDYLVVCLNYGEEEADRLVALSAGEIMWEKELPGVINTIALSEDNRLFVNWQEGETPYLGALSTEGELLWTKEQHQKLATDKTGQIIVTTNEHEILSYNRNAEKIWNYKTSGRIKSVTMAQNGMYLAAVVLDETIQQEELHYLNINGNKIWQKRLPSDADVLVGAEGNRVLVASWQQYQDDVTKIYLYDQQGYELNVLNVAGRAQKMAFASQANTLVVGLEDGSIYFLETTEKSQSPDYVDKEITDYYRPVVFTKEEGTTHLQLFFFDENAEYLIPVTRSIKNSQSLLRDTIQELIRGPAQNSGLVRTIPKDADITVTEKDGTVYIDLPASLDERAGTAFLQGVLDSLLYTVSSIQIDTIKQIRFTVDGKEQERFGQEGINIGGAFIPRPFGKTSKESLIFLPHRSGLRFYLRPEAISLPELKGEARIRTIVEKVIESYNKKFGIKIVLNSLQIKKNSVYVDFDASFNRTLTNTPLAAARAAMLRDAIALSLVENLPETTTVKFTVEGNEPDQPSHYKPWELAVRRPYYINMEN
ncbi:MAG: PQQ-binding-like beta-propeller repeat protein [Firmicutes bacterium]|nr:PQQ-binding-like beta-propeller repeat protein [Bacillota bacterium]